MRRVQIPESAGGSPSLMDIPQATEPDMTGEISLAAREISRRHFLDILYRKYWASLVGWLRQRYGSGPPTPEDLAQIAFEKIAVFENFSNIQHPKAFLYRVASNAALDEIAWLRRTREFIDDELYRKGAAIDEMTPEEVALARERFGHMTLMLERLSPKQREILIRSRLRGETFERIATETGWSKSDVFRQFRSSMLRLSEAVRAYDRSEG